MARGVLTAGAMLRWILPLSVLLVACGREDERVVAPPSTSVAAEDVVRAAVEERFERSVKATFLDGQGMTVRGLARAVALPKASKAREALDPARYDTHAPTSAKLEIVGGKVVYTAAARGQALGAGGQRLVVSYEVSAEVSPDGELRDLSILQLD